MQVIADLEVHSKYARAVSSSMTPPIIAEWAARKGIGLVGTGDFTHPLWLRELEANLEEAGEGVYRLKSKSEVKFLLTSEVSCMYTHLGKGRRVHLLVYLPDFTSVHKFNSELTRRGCNLFSDGRPIIGLTLNQVAEIALSVSQRAILIPAHVWTPWFGFYGSMSGYDSLKEAFGDLEKYIPAVETGLSSDPAMNWRIIELEQKQIVSFGDAHSPQKLGREATVFQIKKSKIKNQNDKSTHSTSSGLMLNKVEASKFKISYQDIYDAIWNKPEAVWEIGYTIEFYPEEGKYHYTGHRNCNIAYSPNEARKKGSTCPVCGKTLTMGVASRVEQLATQEISNDKLQISNDKFGAQWIRDEKGKRPPYVMLVPLLEILAESLELGVSSQKVTGLYDHLVEKIGSEFNILLKATVEDIRSSAGSRVAEAIAKVRSGDISVKPGYDGVFGTVKIWPTSEVASESGMKTDQAALF